VGTSVQTNQRVNTATVKVSSRDYGGWARLQATVNIDGLVIPAMVTENSEAFARIPIDICKFDNLCKPPTDQSDDFSNRIADVWERQYASNYLADDEDSEGSGMADVPGDGYSPHDEYRGFMIRNPNDDGSAILLRSDPKSERNLMFFDDQSGLAPVVLGSVASSVQSLGIRVHQIHSASMDFATSDGVHGPASPQNRFSLNPGTRRGYAVVIITGDVDRPGLTFGKADGQSCTSGPDIQLGARINNGSGPIVIDDVLISSYASANSYSEARFLSHVVSHEFGHRLGLAHTERSYPHSQAGTSGGAEPGTYRYWLLTPRELYSWEHEYQWTSSLSENFFRDHIDFLQYSRSATSLPTPLLNSTTETPPAPSIGRGEHRILRERVWMGITTPVNTQLPMIYWIHDNSLMDYFPLPHLMHVLEPDQLLAFTSQEQRSIRLVTCRP
jgi:hypothetical protein